mmetsp:Transcript_38798/g.115379  ORF Transcript_38798/g.115379 Transcript_38798/m.115379 type:complete len:212 (+) Transcript_38798:249-884(+)
MTKHNGKARKAGTRVGSALISRNNRVRGPAVPILSALVALLRQAAAVAAAVGAAEAADTIWVTKKRGAAEKRSVVPSLQPRARGRAARRQPRGPRFGLWRRLRPAGPGTRARMLSWCMRSLARKDTAALAPLPRPHRLHASSPSPHVSAVRMCSALAEGRKGQQRLPGGLCVRSDGLWEPCKPPCKHAFAACRTPACACLVSAAVLPACFP